jgi:hypothetical protein
MHRARPTHNPPAFTLIELIVIAAILAIVALMAVPMRYEGYRSKRAGCLNNLKQIGVSDMLFAADYTNRLPWQVATTNGGSMEYILVGYAAPHFGPIAKYNVISANGLLCPTDMARRPARSPAQTVDANISYFVNVDATLDATAMLAGDRNLQLDGKALKPGLLPLPPRAALDWGPDLHTRVEKHPCGMVVFGDGHAEATKAESLVKSSGRWSATNRLAIP